MKNALWLMVVAILTSFGPVGLAADAPNEKLVDVMYLLADQSVGIATFAKTPSPGGLEDKDFARAMHRVTGTKYVFNLIREKRGGFTEGVFVEGELTPSKFLTTPPEELAAYIEKFDQAMDTVVAVFDKIGTEISNQRTLAPAERNFRSMKLLLIELDDAMKAAHTTFKP